MASVLGRVLTIGALVVGVPAACLTTMLFYGKALSEAEVAEGILRSPEEIRALREEAHRRFVAMSPAAHLAAARASMASGYDPATRSGGMLGNALHHLDAVAAGTPEAAEADALRAEVERRRQAVYDEASRRLGAQLRDAAAVARADEAQRQTRRAVLAHALDELSARGLGCVHAGGPTMAVLRFDDAGCSQATLDRIVRAEHLDGLRAYGFQRVRCRNRRGGIVLVPDAGVGGGGGGGGGGGR